MDKIVTILPLTPIGTHEEFDTAYLACPECDNVLSDDHGIITNEEPKSYRLVICWATGCRNNGKVMIALDLGAILGEEKNGD